MTHVSLLSTRGPNFSLWFLSPKPARFFPAVSSLNSTMAARKTTTAKTTRRKRLSPAQWIEAEELYRNGWTQAQIAKQFKIRIETVSRHMTKRSVKGGERAETVREELSAALAKKQRDFAESKAQRQIDSKEMLYKMTNILLGAFAKEFQAAMTTGRGLAALSGSAKALKDSLLSMKVGREELYSLLEIKDDGIGDALPDLVVASMTVEEEEALRARVAPDDEEDFAADIADVIERVDHAVEMQSD